MFCPATISPPAYGNRGGDGTHPGNKPGENCTVTWHGTHVAGITAATDQQRHWYRRNRARRQGGSARTVNNCERRHTCPILLTVLPGPLAEPFRTCRSIRILRRLSTLASMVSDTARHRCKTPSTTQPVEGVVVVVISGNYSVDASNDPTRKLSRRYYSRSARIPIRQDG